MNGCFGFAFLICSRRYLTNFHRKIWIIYTATLAALALLYNIHPPSPDDMPYMPPLFAGRIEKILSDTFGNGMMRSEYN